MGFEQHLALEIDRAVDAPDSAKSGRQRGKNGKCVEKSKSPIPCSRPCQRWWLRLFGGRE